MLNSIFDFAILALAGWTFASLLVSEDGPYAMFHRLREWAGVKLSVHLDPATEWGTILAIAERKELSPDENGAYSLPVRYGHNPDSTLLTEVAWALTCVWCTSMWVMIVLFVLYGLLSISGGTGILIGSLYPFAARTLIIGIDKALQ